MEVVHTAITKQYLFTVILLLMLRLLMMRMMAMMKQAAGDVVFVRIVQIQIQRFVCYFNTILMNE